MAYEPKTKPTEIPVSEFIAGIDNETKRDDARRLVEIFTSKTGFDAYMWGPTIIGFGSYHYKYDSGHEGDAPLAGFSPRKDALVLYLSDYEGREIQLAKLGKHKLSKTCIYLKKLEGIDISVLETMIEASVEHMKRLYL
ncbi:DUF1801 domain-containing protein [Flavobacterium selenitireducens]|uniref:DUF1801 domain-containing protein n=1 Tax=Flavobacterium selenitireducens TaxID=2722704 RepID=UPI00168ACB68|nr:DUF1801 domain-containing protein [Flavobacterium selenitireducens]MBD3583805.1 DUF1801 domain-containing protein [Flavobacterium selenitireducens]